MIIKYSLLKNKTPKNKKKRSLKRLFNRGLL